MQQLLGSAKKQIMFGDPRVKMQQPRLQQPRSPKEVEAKSTSACIQQNQDGNVLGKLLPDTSNRNLQHTRAYESSH